MLLLMLLSLCVFRLQYVQHVFLSFSLSNLSRARNDSLPIVESPILLIVSVILSFFFSLLFLVRLDCHLVSANININGRDTNQ